MRDLIITQNITLDGVIDATDGWFAPADDSVDQSDLNEALLEQAAQADGFLVGRVTFEDMRGYWPQQTNDTTGVTDYLNKVQKYVVSTTLQDPQWANTTVLSGDLKENITALKSQPGKDIVTTGSIRLTHALIESALVDEFRLFVHPVVLGHGARLFDRHRTNLNLVETRRFTSGVTLLRYRVA